MTKILLLFNALDMVIRLASEYGKRPVKLFDKEKADHLVREGHLRKRQFIIRPLVHRLVETIRSTNHKYKIVNRAELLFIDEF